MLECCCSKKTAQHLWGVSLFLHPLGDQPISQPISAYLCFSLGFHWEFLCFVWNLRRFLKISSASFFEISRQFFQQVAHNLFTEGPPLSNRSFA